MRQPCENLLKALLIGGDERWSLESVANYAVGLGYPRPLKKYLTYLRDSLYFDRPRPHILSNAETRQWLSAKGLLAIIDPEDVALEAERIRKESDLCGTLDILLMSGIPWSELNQYMGKFLGTTFSEEVLQHYREFYWNVQLLNSREWEEFLIGPRGYEGGTDLWNCYVSEPEWTLHKLGADPDNFGLRDMTEHLGKIAYYKAYEVSRMPPGYKNSLTFLNYSTVVTKALENTGGSSTLAQVLDKLHEVALRYENPKEAKLLESKIVDAEIVDGNVLPDVKSMSKIGKGGK